MYKRQFWDGVNLNDDHLQQLSELSDSLYREAGTFYDDDTHQVDIYIDIIYIDAIYIDTIYIDNRYYLHRYYLQVTGNSRLWRRLC